MRAQAVQDTGRRRERKVCSLSLLFSGRGRTVSVSAAVSAFQLRCEWSHRGKHFQAHATMQKQLLELLSSAHTQIAPPPLESTSSTSCSPYSPEVTQELDLTQRALAEHGMVKGRDALDGDLCRARDVDGRAGCQLWCSSLLLWYFAKRAEVTRTIDTASEHQKSDSRDKSVTCTRPRSPDRFTSAASRCRVVRRASR